MRSITAVQSLVHKKTDLVVCVKSALSSYPRLSVCIFYISVHQRFDFYQRIFSVYFHQRLSAVLKEAVTTDKKRAVIFFSLLDASGILRRLFFSFGYVQSKFLFYGFAELSVFKTFSQKCPNKSQQKNKC